MVKTEIRKRIESALWRGAMMTLALLIDASVQSLSGFNIPKEYVVVLGLILGEISKYLKNQYDYKQEVARFE